MLWFLIGSIVGLIVGFIIGLITGTSYAKEKFQEELDILDDMSSGDLKLMLRSLMLGLEEEEKCCGCCHEEDDEERCCGCCHCHKEEDEEEGE